MQLTNSSERWGAISQLFHWTVVALIITQFTLASIADNLPLGMQKLAWLARHKSVGITILGIVIFRLLWRLRSPGPALPSNLGPLERILARVTHVGLYLILFLMPISGWLMSSAKGYPVSWFKLVQLPDLIAKNEDAFKLLKTCHETLAGVLIALALLHVAGALKHQFIYKDGVLKRMLPCLALALAFAITAVGWPLQALATELASDTSNSKLSFSFMQAGGLNTGNFKEFQVQLDDAGGAIAGGTLTVKIDTKSLDTDDTERDGILRDADLFDVKRFPAARFSTTKIESAGENAYRAVGTLTIRDKSHDVELPLTVRHAKETGVDVSYLNGKIAIKRLDYGVGQGEWESTEWVDDEVTIEWTVRLVPSATGASP